METDKNAPSFVKASKKLETVKLNVDLIKHMSLSADYVCFDLSITHCVISEKRSVRFVSVNIKPFQTHLLLNQVPFSKSQYD